MKTFNLQIITINNCELIRELAGKVWYHTYEDIHTLEQLEFMFEDMYNIETLKKQIHAGVNYFIADDVGIPVGYVAFQQKDKDLFYLQKLYVLPEYQGTGAGKFLLNAVIKKIKETHPEPCSLELNVNRQNNAIQFYERMGMVKFHESDDEIGNGFIMNNCFMRMDI